MIDKNRIYENMKRLVAVPGISGTDSEVETAYKLKELLYEVPYFKNNKENVELIPIEGDVFNRCVVTAYLECCPESKKVVVLTGHYDVVGIEEYGSLKDIAFDVEAISERINEMPLDEDSKKDFESGEWIFGRGTADMKFGHSMCIELLRHFSETKNINGNLLYVAVCGEETNSEGMLRAVPFFNQFKAKKNIEYEALLLTECFMMEDQTKETNRYIHMGACGKVMPMFFFVGESSHGGEPFLGIDPNLMAGEVYKRFNLNSDFCQSAFGEITPPPVCIKNQDLKTSYSLSTPLYTASYYNIVSIDLKPEELMFKLQEIAEKSFRSSIKFVEEQVKKYEKNFGVKPVEFTATPHVITFDKLYKEAKETYKGDLDKDIKEMGESLLENKLEMQDVAIQIVKKVYELSPNKKPTIIVGFIPPYYPDVYPDKKDPKVERLINSISNVISYAKEQYGETLKMKDYYMGLSDLSYTGIDPEKNFDEIFKNLVGINQIYSLPEEDLKQFCVPGIVLGGYGKDFHKHTERLDKHYNFDVLPDLYDRLIRGILK